MIEHLYSIIDKIVFIIILMASGILAKRQKWVSEQGEKDLGLLMTDFVWPCMIFSSIVTSLDAADIADNIWLPALSVLMHLIGYALGLGVCALAGYRGDRRKMFLFHASLNNFLVMALPFVQYFCPGRGTALLSIANLGSILCLWTLGVFICAGNLGLRRTLRNLNTPGLFATAAAILCVITGVNRHIPALLTDAMHIAGQPTMLLGLMIAGTQIHKLGRQALKLDAWNMAVGFIRNLAVPCLMLLLALALRGSMTTESLVIFMIIGMTPASVNSVTLAMKYGSSPGLAAEGVVFTHILAVPTMVCFVMLMEKYILHAA